MKPSIIEMSGMLRGRCIPCDMKVNESLSAYLVRQFDYLNDRADEAERERDELRKTLTATQGGAVEAANHSLKLQADRDNWRTNFDNERLRADKLWSEIERRDAAAGEPVAYTSQANIDAVSEKSPKQLEFMSGDKSIYRNPVALYTAAQPSAPDRNMLRELVDVVWRYATESTSVPATGTADGLIDKVFNISAMPVESRYSDGPVTIPMASFYRDGIEAAASYLDAQREAFDHEHGQHDPDTGAFEFGNVAAQDHSATLAELSEAIRGLHPNAGNSPAIPDGWKLVPVEPTIEMRQQIHPVSEGTCLHCFSRVSADCEENMLLSWRDMLSAAPASGGEPA